MTKDFEQDLTLDEKIEFLSSAVESTIGCILEGMPVDEEESVDAASQICSVLIRNSVATSLFVKGFSADVLKELNVSFDKVAEDCAKAFLRKLIEHMEDINGIATRLN